jgi:hypothetical protein
MVVALPEREPLRAQEPRCAREPQCAHQNHFQGVSELAREMGKVPAPQHEEW